MKKWVNAYLFFVCMYTTALGADLVPLLWQFEQSLNELARLLNTMQPPTPPPVNVLSGITFRFTNPTEHFYQLQVLKQRNNANCGYYALKDTLYTLHALEGTAEEQKQLPALLQSKQLYQSDYTTWSKEIANYRKEKDLPGLEKQLAAAQEIGDAETIQDILKEIDELGKSTDWLDGAEIEWLYNNKTPNKPQTPLWTIDNIDWISESNDYQGLALNPRWHAILTHFRNQENFMYGFLLNDAREFTEECSDEEAEGAVCGGSGHWIGVVVVKKSGIFNYYITDSLGHNKTNSPIIKTLKKFIENDNINHISIIISPIQDFLHIIELNIPRIKSTTGEQFHAVHTIIENIQQAIAEAKDLGFFASPEFEVTKQLLASYLHQIQESDNIPAIDLPVFDLLQNELFPS